MGWPRLLLLAGTLLFISLMWHVQVLDRIVVALLIVLALSWVWTRFSLPGLGIERSIALDKVSVGDEFIEDITLTNHSWLPKLWLEFEDASTLPGHTTGRVVSLRGRQSVTWTTSTVAVRRGRFRLGPATVSAGDPFGLFESSRSLPVSHDVLVLPARLDVSQIQLPTAQLTGGRSAPRAPLVSTATISTIRDYAPGDPMNRIAWRATAHRGQLMVKEFEPDPTADVWILLDLNDDGQFDLQQHADAPRSLRHLHTTVEYTISVGYSLAMVALEQGRRAGMILSRQDPMRIEADNSDRQVTRIGEALAVATSRGSRSISESIQADSRRFSRTSGLIVVTADPRSDWVAAGAALVERLVPVTAVIVDAGGVGPDDMGPLMSGLTAARVRVCRYPTFTAIDSARR